MKTRKPMLGLLTFSYHSIIGSLILSISSALFMGIAAEIFENNIFVMFFLFSATIAAPYLVIQKSEGTPKWEPYLLAMPLKRKNLAAILYLNVFIASLFAIPVLGVMWGVGFIFNGFVTEAILAGGYVSIAVGYGAVLLMAALIYPIGSTKFGARNMQGLFFGCMIAALAINISILFGGQWLGLSSIVISLLSIGISGVAFVVSLFITKAMYAKIDF